MLKDECASDGWSPCFPTRLCRLCICTTRRALGCVKVRNEAGEVGEAGERSWNKIQYVDISTAGQSAKAKDRKRGCPEIIRDQGIRVKKTCYAFIRQLLRCVGMRDLWSSKLLRMEEILHQLVTIGNFETVKTWDQHGIHQLPTGAGFLLSAVLVCKAICLINIYRQFVIERGMSTNLTLLAIVNWPVPRYTKTLLNLSPSDWSYGERKKLESRRNVMLYNLNQNDEST